MKSFFIKLSTIFHCYRRGLRCYRRGLRCIHLPRPDRKDCERIERRFSMEKKKNRNQVLVLFNNELRNSSAGTPLAPFPFFFSCFFFTAVARLARHYALHAALGCRNRQETSRLNPAFHRSPVTPSREKYSKISFRFAIRA